MRNLASAHGPHPCCWHIWLASHHISKTESQQPISWHANSDTRAILYTQVKSIIAAKNEHDAIEHADESAVEKAQILECGHDMYILAQTLAPYNGALAKVLSRPDVWCPFLCPAQSLPSDLLNLIAHPMRRCSPSVQCVPDYDSPYRSLCLTTSRRPRGILSLCATGSLTLSRSPYPHCANS